MSVLVFDIGGTNIRMAYGEGSELLKIQKHPTPQKPEEAISLLTEFGKTLPKLERVCGGVAGVIENGVLRTSPHLALWDNFPLQTALSEALGVPVQLANDAELAALGEAVYGAGKGSRIVAYIGIGTGIGGALVVDGRIAPHARGFEPGHQILDIASNAQFEDLVAGAGLAEEFGAPARELPMSVYEERTPKLAAGLYNAMLEWAPDVLVLGGSLMNEENGYRVQTVRDALAAIPNHLPVLPEVRRAALGDDNGLYGALAFAQQA